MTKQAREMAQAINEMQGAMVNVPSKMNGVMPMIPDDVIEELAQSVLDRVFEESHHDDSYRCYVVETERCDKNADDDPYTCYRMTISVAPTFVEVSAPDGRWSALHSIYYLIEEVGIVEEDESVTLGDYNKALVDDILAV